MPLHWLSGDKRPEFGGNVVVVVVVAAAVGKLGKFPVSIDLEN